MFYNVENLFDYRHDTLKNDTEFLAGGYKNWSSHRMYKKINGISIVILASNGWNPPLLVGLCEVENDFVLKQLIYHTGLNNVGYRYIHYESPDKRGIDVAMLYNCKGFEVLESSPIYVSNVSREFYTRDCLYVKGIAHNRDTIHVFVNHWPSKRGGVLVSEKKREYVAQIISAKVDSIQKVNTTAKIIAMGDFNADNGAPSLQYLSNKNKLLSPFLPKDINHKKVGGSHKYQGKWSLIDHILLSCYWLDTALIKYQIISLPFLLEEDLSYSGLKPRRTYAGPNYIGGVSDHLPVSITVKIDQ